MGTTLTVDGMSCEHCEQTVEDALTDVAGVERARADREAARATVEGTAEPGDLVAAVEAAGYEASV